MVRSCIIFSCIFLAGISPSINFSYLSFSVRFFEILINLTVKRIKFTYKVLKTAMIPEKEVDR